MEFGQITIDAVTEYAERAGLPTPTREIGDGRDSVVYATKDPYIAVKISVSMGGFELLDLQGNPGVIKIFHHKEIQVDDNGLLRFGYGFEGYTNLLVLWEEHLIETGSGIFKILGIGRDEADEIMEDLDMVNGARPAPIPSLSRYRAFKALNALIATQWWSDMGIHQVGLSKTGQVVLFDNA